MPTTRLIYRATCTMVDRANALCCTIRVGLLVRAWLSLIPVPAVSAKPATIRSFLALRSAMPDSDDHEESVEAHPTRLLIRFEPSTSRTLEKMIHARAGVDRVLRRFRSVEWL